MTITNHIRKIEELSEKVIEYVDDREYRQAHHVITSIERRCLLAHEHVDYLQSVTPRDIATSKGD